MRILIALATTAAIICVAGCNTVSGVGRDMQAAGHAVTHSAEEVSH